MKLTLAILVLFGLSTTWALPEPFFAEENQSAEGIEKLLLETYGVSNYTGKLMRWTLTGIGLALPGNLILSVFFYS